MSSPAEQPAASRWPRQIKYIVGNEACERFSYYGMKGILAGYITGTVLQGGLGQSADSATEIISLFVSANYFMPLLGAWLSDKIIGRYHTILWVSLFYCAGHGVLACSDYAGDVHGKMICLATGLSLIAFGSGGIKPCVSAFMGDQFRPDQAHLLQKAYGAFYWAINFGSFFSFLVIPWVKDHHGYSVAFAVPGILMAIATFIFWLGTKYYTRVPTNRQLKHAGFFAVFWSAFRASPQFRISALVNLLATIGLPLLAITLMAVLGFSKRSGESAQFLGWSALICVGVWYLLVIGLSLLRKTELPDQFWAGAAGRHGEKEISGARSFTPILFIFAFVPIFWTLFDQTSSTWVLQGQQMTPFMFGELSLIEFFSPHWTLVSFCAGGVAQFIFLAVILRKFALTQHFRSIGKLSLALTASIIGTILFTWFVFCLPKIHVGAEEMQSMNPLVVMVLVPLFTLGIYPHIGRFASPLKRMACGMFVAAGAYLVVAAIQKEIEGGAHPCVLWQTVPYVVLTAAEVLFSTTGLEFAFREAAPELKSTIMSFWLLTITMGDLLIVTVTKMFASTTNSAASVSTGRFLQYAGMTLVVAVLFSIVAAFYKYRDQSAAAGK